jgi:hypothetical protein
MRRRIRRVLAPALVGATILLIGSAPATAPAQPPSKENHYRCYIVSKQTPQPAAAITLDDQFTAEPVATMVGEPVMICAPTEKSIVGGATFPIEEEEQHFVLYNAPAPAEPRTVFVTDQFGTDVEWQVTTPKYILVPTAKTVGDDTFEPQSEQHYWCYEANGPRVGVRATLTDQFSGPDLVRVTTPTLFCNPAAKVHPGVGTFPIEEEELHFACYEIHGKQKTEQFMVGVENQFEEDVFQTAAWEIICAPAEKGLP